MSRTKIRFAGITYVFYRLTKGRKYATVFRLFCHLSCWMRKKTSLGGFVGPGAVILFADLVILLYLHSVINRLFPEPMEGEPRVDSSDEEEDENCNREECHVNKCRYKIQPRIYPVVEFRFPKRRELISYLYGSLLVLLLLCLTFTGIAMIYSYQDSKAVYLYKFFSYGSAFCNLFIGVTIFYYHCIKRRDILKHLLLAIHNIRHKPERFNNVEPEALVLLDRESHNVDEHLQVEDIISAHVPGVIDTHGVYGLSDHMVSDGSLAIMATVRVETCKMYEGRGESADDVEKNPTFLAGELLGRSSPAPPESLPLESLPSPESLQSPEPLPPSKRSAPLSQSEYSDQEKHSNAHDSIGECSLASSRPKRPSKNIQIPSNLKDFVPENWRPARRRTNKGASYYPYYISENNPISASLAYSSKSSSLASTTVSGVPLYARMPNTGNMPPHMNRIGPSPLGHHPSAIPPGIRPPLPMVFPNMPMRYPPPGYRGPVPLEMVNPNFPPPRMMQPVPRERSHTPQTGESETERRSFGDGARGNGEGANSLKSDRSFETRRNFEADKSLEADDSFEVDNSFDLNKSVDEDRSLEVDQSLDTTNDKVKGDTVDAQPSCETSPEDDTPHIPVAPSLYIPMPHVSIKQFTLRSETSV